MPHCISADNWETTQYDPAHKRVSSTHAYNRNTWSYTFYVFPDLYPARYEEAHWGFEKYDDPETAYTSGITRDWDTGYTSALDFPACGRPSPDQSNDAGYVIPLAKRAPVDWKRDAPTRKTEIRAPVPRGDGGPPTGFVYPRAAQVSPSVWFWAAAIDPRTLWVEVHDPGIHDESKEWLHRSHIEIWNWTGPALAADGSECFTLRWLKTASHVTGPANGIRRASAPQQWAVELVGNHKHVGYGTTTADALETEVYRVDASTVRLKIVLPPPPRDADAATRRVAITYSVSDGRKQVALLASTALRRADPRTFGWIGDLGGWF